jgi:thiamine-monophosphate kinase
VDEADLIRHVAAQAASSAAPLPAGWLGIGDDCCQWTPGGPTVLSTDAIVEGRHFLPGTDPALVGRKAAAAALSDLAAMGARPVGAAVALCCPAGWNGAAIMDGLTVELTRHGCPLMGGDTTGADQLAITVTVWGEATPMADGKPGRLLRRSTATPGDLLVVTGPLGGSFASGRHLRPEPRFAEGAWLAHSPYAHAMMDLSDGLAADAPKLAEASGCGVLLIPDKIPVHDDVPSMADGVRAACCDGEDYELLAAVAAEHWPNLQLAWPFDHPLIQVGWLLPQRGAFIEAGSRMVPLPWTGFEHRL